MVNTPSSLHTEIRFLMRWFAQAKIKTPPAVLHMRCASKPVRNPDESASLTCDKSRTILLCPPEFRSTNSAFILGADSPSNTSTWGWMTTYFRSEEHTSELQSLMRISYAVFCL